MNSLIKDVAVLSTIPEDSLNKLVQKSLLSICSSVEESKIKNENLVDIDIGIGILYIQYDQNNVKYKFIPSHKLEEAVRKTINIKNPLQNVLEKTLASKITKTYKDIF